MWSSCCIFDKVYMKVLNRTDNEQVDNGAASKQAHVTPHTAHILIAASAICHCDIMVYHVIVSSSMPLCNHPCNMPSSNAIVLSWHTVSLCNHPIMSLYHHPFHYAIINVIVLSWYTISLCHHSSLFHYVISCHYVINIVYNVIIHTIIAYHGMFPFVLVALKWNNKTWHCLAIWIKSNSEIIILQIFNGK